MADSNFIIDKEGAKVYSDLQKHKLLPVPRIKSRYENGDVYHVLSVRTILTSGKNTPTVTIKFGKEVELFRLPIQYLDWVKFCTSSASLEGNFFPSDVQFGYIIGEDRYYAEVLESKNQALHKFEAANMSNPLYCKKCGGILVIGLGESNVTWCPACEGIQIQTFDESKKNLISCIKEDSERIKHLIEDYRKEELMITIYVTREGDLLSRVPDYWSFVGLSELLNQIGKIEKLGDKHVEWNDENIQELYYRARRVNMSKKYISLLRNGWICFLKIEQAKLFTYGFDILKSMFVDEIKPETELENSEGMVSLLKFTSKWMEVFENMESNGLITNTEAFFGSTTQQGEDDLDEFWTSILTKIGLESHTGDLRLLDFPELNHSLDYIKILEKLVTEIELVHNLERNEHGRVTSLDMKPLDLKSFYLPFFQNGLDLSNVDTFIKILSQPRELGYPILLQTNKGLVVGQQTVLLTAHLLKGKYFREYLDSTRNVGLKFEQQVVDKLEEYGMRVTIPNDPSQKFVNIKDDKEHPTLEIDIVAYNNNIIYLVECKHIVISNEFITQNRQSVVRRVLKDEPEKMKRRISFLSKNLELFGFSSEMKDKIVPLFVTYNKEPLSEYEGIRIISIANLFEVRNFQWFVVTISRKSKQKLISLKNTLLL